MKLKVIAVLLVLFAFSCEKKKEEADGKLETIKKTTQPFKWENANFYFMLTDRFNNGDPTNDTSYGRKQDGSKLRSYLGGDLTGITSKINSGYFDQLGVNAIWFTPPYENVHGYTDEGTGKTYAFHGYWIKDWTNIDANVGGHETLKELVEAAHAKGIRIVLDVIINHTGPVTEMDPVWPDEWVRTTPQCTYQDFESTVTCTLVKNLPDIKTESDADVELPEGLVEKWKAEGRYEQEMKELDEFFARTGYPKAPRFYIIKWLTDYVRELGIDGYRVDTAKHTEPGIWAELYKEAVQAFNDWKTNNPDKVLDDNEFYMVGEVYNYNIQSGQGFNMGDSIVNFYQNGFKSLINFSFKGDANKDFETLFSSYDSMLSSDALTDYSVLNYISSHDDGYPFDKKRERTYESATKLLLTPGASQIYYGDETGRSLDIPDAHGDATLRSFMNWEDLESNEETKALFAHWSKLGQFRNKHLAVGIGNHNQISSSPYTFSRVYEEADVTDKIVVSIDNSSGIVDVGDVFQDGEILTDTYTNQKSTVTNGQVTFENPGRIILLSL